MNGSNVRNREYLVKREITANDVRARILIVPQIIKNSIPLDKSVLEVEVNGQSQTLTLDKSRRYLAGVTKIYRDCGLINKENEFIRKKAKWAIINDRIIIDIE